MSHSGTTWALQMDLGNSDAQHLLIRIGDMAHTTDHYIWTKGRLAAYADQVESRHGVYMGGNDRLMIDASLSKQHVINHMRTFAAIGVLTIGDAAIGRAYAHQANRVPKVWILNDEIDPAKDGSLRRMLSEERHGWLAAAYAEAFKHVVGRTGTTQYETLDEAMQAMVPLADRGFVWNPMTKSWQKGSRSAATPIESVSTPSRSTEVVETAEPADPRPAASNTQSAANGGRPRRESSPVSQVPPPAHWSSLADAPTPAENQSPPQRPGKPAASARGGDGESDALFSISSPGRPDAANHAAEVDEEEDREALAWTLVQWWLDQRPRPPKGDALKAFKKQNHRVIMSLLECDSTVDEIKWAYEQANRELPTGADLRDRIGSGGPPQGRRTAGASIAASARGAQTGSVLSDDEERRQARVLARIREESA